MQNQLCFLESTLQPALLACSWAKSTFCYLVVCHFILQGAPQKLGLDVPVYHDTYIKRVARVALMLVSYVTPQPVKRIASRREEFDRASFHATRAHRRALCVRIPQIVR